MQKIKLTILFLAFIFLPTIAHGATEFVSVIDPDNGSGTDYTSLSAWEAANQVDLTSATTLVIAGSLTRGTIADGTPITQTTSGATAVCVHHTATQMLISTLTGTPNATDTWFPTVDGSDVTNAWTPTTAGDSAIAIAKCRSTAGTADTTAVTVDGWTTSATNYIKIWTDPSENCRHNGVWDEGKYRLEVGANYTNMLKIPLSNIIVDGIQINGNNKNYVVGINAGEVSKTNIIVRNNIIKNINDNVGNYSAGIYSYYALGTVIYNNIIYNIAGNGGIYTSNWTGGYIYNNTVFECLNGIRRGGADGTGPILKNNIAYNNTDNYSGTFDASSTNNLSGPTQTDAPGSNPRNGYVVHFADEANDDFHLDSADTAARNQGIILYDSGDDANLNFTTDIDNNARLDSAGTWDIGADEAITKVYRSVGPNASSALATGATYGNVEIKPAYVSGSTTNIADYVATFWSDLPTNVGVGDALQYDDDDDGDIDASDSIVFITKRIDASHYSVRTATGTAPASTLAPDSDWSIFRSYTSLFNAEAGDENDSIDDDLEAFESWSGGKNLQTGQEQWNIAAYANGTTADTVATMIFGWSTTADSYLKIYTPTRSDEVGISQRHSGKWSSGVYSIEISASADYDTAIVGNGIFYLRVEGLQFKLTNNDYGYQSAISAYSINDVDLGEWYISNNLVEGIFTTTNDDSQNGFVMSEGDNVTYNVWNNTLYGIGQGGGSNSYSIHHNNAKQAYIYNNTIANCNHGIRGNSSNTLAMNNIAYNCASAYGYSFDPDSDFNLGFGASLNATFTGYDGTPVFLSTSTYDFHLSSSDTAAKNAGTDLSNDPYIPSNTDIDSACLRKDNQSRISNGGDDSCYTRPRGTSWDIGADELITKIYRSVAPDADGTLEALTTGASNAMTIASSTATFATALADNIGVGDAIQYDADGDSDIDASDSIVFISARTDSTHFTVKTASGAIPTAVSADTDWSLFRAYTSLANAETGTENLAIDADLRNFDSWSGGRDIAASSEQWNIACYANGTTADATRVTVSGWTTAAQNYLKIYTPTLVTEVGTSQRHNGAWNTSKYNFSNDIDSTAVSYVRIDGLQMFMTGDDGGYMVRVINSGPKTEISNNIVRANLTGSQAHIGIMEGYAGITKIYNNIIYDFNGNAGNEYGIYVTGGTNYVYNNTIYNCEYGIAQAYSGTILIAKNNIVKGSGNTNAYAGTFINSDYNATDGTDVGDGGAHSKISQTFSFVDEANNDFHLSPSDTAARNACADLSQDYNLPITNDIDGNARTSNYQYPNSNYDIGADESATPIYRSIAPSMSTYLDRGVDESGTDLSISGTTLTLENAAPDNVGVGDAIQYDSDGNSSIDAIAFISARASSTSFTVQARDGANPVAVTNDQDWQIFRAYTTLDNAEGGAENTANIDDDVDDFDISVSRNDGKDIYASNEQWNIAAYANVTTADETAVTINDWTTYSTNYIKVYTPVSASEVGTSQRHQGKWDNGKYNMFTSADSWAGLIRIQDEYIRVDGIQIKNNSNSDTSNPHGIYVDIGYDVQISNNILVAAGGGTRTNGEAGLQLDGIAANSTVKIWNNIIYGFGTGILYDYGTLWNAFHIYNNSLINNSARGIQIQGNAGDVSLQLKNNICADNPTADYAVSSFTSFTHSNNLSSDATSPDISYRSLSVSFADAANSDFHLSSSDTSARDAGVNLWDDSVLSVREDIDGDPRSESVENWDIGADEGIFYQSNVSGMGTATMQMSLTDKMTDGLVGMWSFDGPDIDWTTNTAYDRSPAGGNDGTITGATPAIGKKGQALSFSQAIGNKIDLGQPTFNLTNQISISAWVKSVQDDYGTIISKHGNNPSYGWKLSRFADLDLFEWRISTNGTDWNGGFASNDSFPINTWINVVATYDNSFMRVYINGVENITGDFPYILNGNIYNSSATAQIGRNDYNGDSTIFNGQIDEVRVYNRALSSDEVLRLLSF